MNLAHRRTTKARDEQCASEGAEGNCHYQLKIFHIHSIKCCRRCRGCVALRGTVLLSQEIVRLRRVECASRRLPLRSSHHLAQERHYLAFGDTLLLLICLPLLVPHIRTERWILTLYLLVCQLVCLNLTRVFHANARSSCHCCELIAVCEFGV